MAMLDDLLEELLNLSRTPKSHDIPFILGGGMGLLVRDTYHKTARQHRYPVAVPSRSTKDLDLFLTADVIADAEKMNTLRDLLAERGYTSRPEALYFQFERSLGTASRSVRIDLLTAPPRDVNRDRVKIKGGCDRMRVNASTPT